MLHLLKIQDDITTANITIVNKAVEKRWKKYISKINVRQCFI